MLRWQYVPLSDLHRKKKEAGERRWSGFQKRLESDSVERTRLFSRPLKSIRKHRHWQDWGQVLVGEPILLLTYEILDYEKESLVMSLNFVKRKVDFIACIVVRMVLALRKLRHARLHGEAALEPRIAVTI